ncbi:MAG: peptide deformylase [Thermodesulfobacteriota bacterium]
MAQLRICTYPEAILRQPARPVDKIDDGLQETIEDMADTMYDAPGVGLAAVQAGIDQCIIVYDPAADPEKRKFETLINPTIIEYQGETVSENEGCLSVPDFRCDVKRAERVIVKGRDRDGNDVRFEAEGVPALILQHEIDHLNGILFIDRISALKRQIYKRKRMKALKNS